MTPEQAEFSASTSKLLQQRTRHMRGPRSSPDPRVVYVGGEQQLVVLVPGHAPDLVWHSINDKRLGVHLVEVIQAQLLLITCTPQLKLHRSVVSDLLMSCTAGEHSLSLRIVYHSVRVHSIGTAYVDQSWPLQSCQQLPRPTAGQAAKASSQIAVSNRIPAWQRQSAIGHQGLQRIAASIKSPILSWGLFLKDKGCKSCTSCDELGALFRKLAGAHNVRMLQRVQLVACYGVPQLRGEVC